MAPMTGKTGAYNAVCVCAVQHTTCYAAHRNRLQKQPFWEELRFVSRTRLCVKS